MRSSTVRPSLNLPDADHTAFENLQSVNESIDTFYIQVIGRLESEWTPEYPATQAPN
jgi:hypothetical protein